MSPSCRSAWRPHFSRTADAALMPRRLRARARDTIAAGSRFISEVRFAPVSCRPLRHPRRPRAPGRARSAAGCAPGAIPRRASRSCTSDGSSGGAEHRAQLRATRCCTHCGLRGGGDGDTGVPSPGKGQRLRCRPPRPRRRLGGESEHLSDQPKPHIIRVLRQVQHLRPRTNAIGAVARVRHTIARPSIAFFDGAGFLWVSTADHHRSDARGPARCSGFDAGSDNVPRTPEGQVDFAQDFFGREAFAPSSGQLNVETYAARAAQGVHLRPDVSRREFQHQPAPR